MKEIRRYEFDGLILDIAIHYDEQSKMYIEDYPDLIQDPIWSPNGNRVLFSGTDACRYAEEATAGGCPDCGSCKHYTRAGERTWIGVCTNPKNQKQKQ